MTLQEIKERAKTARILVVGDAMLDRYWHGVVDRISPEAPVPVVLVKRIEDRPGGAANVAMNARALGADVSMISLIGADEPGAAIVDALSKAGIHPLITQDKRISTIVKTRVIGRAQQMLRIDFEETPCNEALTSILDEFGRAIDTHDVVILSDYAKGGLTQIQEMIRIARKAGKPILIDPKGMDYWRYSGATLMTPNLSEMIDMAGGWNSEDELTEIAQDVRTRIGLESIVMTRSENGMTLYDEMGRFHVPTQAREVFDVTGAGDTVISTIAVLMACGVPMREIIPLANKAGGIAVGKFGTSCVTAEELFA